MYLYLINKLTNLTTAPWHTAGISISLGLRGKRKQPPSEVACFLERLDGLRCSLLASYVDMMHLWKHLQLLKEEVAGKRTLQLFYFSVTRTARKCDLC